MSDDQGRQRFEAVHTLQRIAELWFDPVRGNFDAAHLREIHRRIFQDIPRLSLSDVKPGEYRAETPAGFDRIKYRKLETRKEILPVAYSSMSSRWIDRIEKVLEEKSPRELSKLNTVEFANAMGNLYAELDYIHPFDDGNSRALREFTRELAKESGYELDWEHFNTNGFGRDVLYVARDKSVNEIALLRIGNESSRREIATSLARRSRGKITDSISSMKH